jgi:hypothetical protein
LGALRHQPALCGAGQPVSNLLRTPQPAPLKVSSSTRTARYTLRHNAGNRICHRDDVRLRLRTSIIAAQTHWGSRGSDVSKSTVT